MSTSDDTSESVSLAELWPLLDRYLAGECSHDEAAQVRRWIRDNAEARVMLAELERIRHVASEPVGAWDVDAMWQRAAAHVESSNTQEQHPEPAALSEAPAYTVFSTPLATRTALRPHQRWTSSTPWFVAAALLIVTIVLGLCNITYWSSAKANIGTTVVATTTGQRASTQLPDGTQITLAPGSTLRYAANYNVTDRIVHIDGEAYFNVIHATTKPFFVIAGGTRTQVLGTSFSVQKYADDPTVQVIVSSGRVAVSNTTLARGDIANINQDGRAQITHVTDPELLLGWTHDTLSFEHTSARDMLATLGRWYDLDFELQSPSIEAEQFSGTFTHQSTDDIIRSVSALLSVHATRTGNHVVLR